MPGCRTSRWGGYDGRWLLDATHAGQYREEHTDHDRELDDSDLQTEIAVYFRLRRRQWRAHEEGWIHISGEVRQAIDRILRTQIPTSKCRCRIYSQRSNNALPKS